MHIFIIILLLVVCGQSPARAEMRTLVEGLPPVDFDQDTLSAYFTETPDWLRFYAEYRKDRLPNMKILVEGLPPVNIDQDTLSLLPAYFPEMPAQLHAWLENREYRIPQVHETYIEVYTEAFLNHEKYNAISGNFDGIDRQDWVIANFRNDTLKAFICWNADTSKIEQLDISEFRIPYKSMFYQLTFNIISTVAQSEWLNQHQSSSLHNLYGDTTALPTVFTHDGIVFASGGDMWSGGFTRYYHNGHWIRFEHYYAQCCATCGPEYCQQFYEKH